MGGRRPGWCVMARLAPPRGQITGLYRAVIEAHERQLELYAAHG